ncbi:phage lambda Rz-like lysis protein [uncultured Caudovirales phage]|uniref:Phage lambda Rz-like lysis protein n=1 Tax=uncultured Caudovirales phage TaxID=2100421 RepID=A0A6J5LFD9_9CAUD|nr:phage lambda Rz-like lysis protein [uncultured Caudovirales phage]
MSILNPYVLLGFICSLLGAYFYGHHSGYQECWLEGQAEVARLNQEARTKEQTLINKVNAKALELKKANDAADQKINSIKSDIASGTLRLSIPTTTSCISASQDASSASGIAATRAELDSKIAESLISITADGDKAIRQLNQCITIYNEIRGEL